MSGDDPQQQLQWGEALLWLAKAGEDVAAARMLLPGGLPELAAFHVQQALEKTLKALLIAAAQDVRRTHDIDTLAVLARAGWPDLVPSPFPLIALNQWYMTSRYPGIEESSPTSVEVADALEAVDSFLAEVISRAVDR